MPHPMNESWLARAERIRAEIAEAEHGEKGAIVNKHAEETGYSVPSLNRDMTAAGFIAQRDADLPEFAKELRRLSSSVVNELARLFKMDKAKAVEQARMAVRGDATRREIIQRRDPRLQRKRQQRSTQQSEFYEFIKTERDPRFSLTPDMPPLSGLPRAITFEARGGVSACAAFVPASKFPPPPSRIVSYLSFLLFYDVLFLGVDSSGLPYDWAQHIEMMRFSRGRLHVFGRLQSGDFVKLYKT